MSEGIRTKILRAEAVVAKNEVLAPGCLVVTLEAPEIAAVIEPAQFVMLRGLDSGFPFLPRPFSVFDVPDPSSGCLEILYEIVGEGTEAMAAWTPGQRVYCLGPLGRSYDVSGAEHPVMIAGGIGIAPFPYLARRLPVETSHQTLLFGARSKGHLYALERFEDLGVNVKIATDDGSAGLHGNTVDLLRDHLAEVAPAIPELYVCGPTPMFKALHPVTTSRGIPCQMSLEERMACGYGACVGCVQAVRDDAVEEGWRYALICTEGPVFDAERILYTSPVPGERSVCNTGCDPAG